MIRLISQTSQRKSNLLVILNKYLLPIKNLFIKKRSIFGNKYLFFYLS
nr:MAG TPA: hypothetical protein [Caudoviricetes sp.]